jgi:hypothetical protein
MENTEKCVIWKISENTMNSSSGTQDVECGEIFSAQIRTTPLTACVITVWRDTYILFF